MISVLVVDDKQWARDEMRILLERARDIQVIGDASNGLEAIEETLELEPDVIVMDTEMPRLDGVQATERILGLGRKVQVVLVAAPADGAGLRKSQMCGARACIGRRDAATELLPAVRAAWAGKTYYGSSVTRAAWVAAMRGDSSGIGPRAQL